VPYFVGCNRLKTAILKISEVNGTDVSFGKIAKIGNFPCCLFCQNSTDYRKKRILVTADIEIKETSKF